MLSSLLLVPITKIDLHEFHEEARLEKVYNAILSLGYLRHPLLVTEMDNGRYLVLDGAHRFQALRKLGCFHIPIQIVNPEKLQLTTWDHQIKRGPWLDHIRSNPLWEYKITSNVEEEWIVCIVEKKGFKSWLVPTRKSKSLVDRLNYWHTIVNSYVKDTIVCRLPPHIKKTLPPDYVRLKYPVWTIDEMKRVVSMNLVFPPGTTQFIVHDRLLNLRIPLELLMNEENLKSEWEKLKNQWSSSLRYYPGGVYLYDGDYVT